MSLAALIQAESSPALPRCKVCAILAALTAEDRDDFESAARSGVAGSVLSRAVSRRAKEFGLADTVGPAAVRTHIGHHL